MSLLLRQTWVAARLLLVMTVILGVGYPLAVYAAGRAVAERSDGSWVTDAGGARVGSELIGQAFDGPRWFTGRPSSAGDGYDGLASAGSNLGPDNPDLVAAVRERSAEVVAENGIPRSFVPADAVTASGSGLDPHISPEYARAQIARVAAARGLPEAAVGALVDAHTEGRMLGFIGEPRVNVLRLNLALSSAG